MKIKREIGGTIYEIELTAEELATAATEHESQADLADITYFLEEYKEDLQEEHGITEEELQELIPDMVERVQDWRESQNYYYPSPDSEKIVDIIFDTVADCCR